MFYKKHRCEGISLQFTCITPRHRRLPPTKRRALQLTLFDGLSLNKMIYFMDAVRDSRTEWCVQRHEKSVKKKKRENFFLIIF